MKENLKKARVSQSHKELFERTRAVMAAMAAKRDVERVKSAKSAEQFLALVKELRAKTDENNSEAKLEAKIEK